MTATPQPGSRAQNKARTRAAIRFAALDLVTEQGYHATTVAQIAAAAGVSHTTLFRYFDSKEQVLVSQATWDSLEYCPNISFALLGSPLLRDASLIGGWIDSDVGWSAAGRRVIPLSPR